MRPRIGEGRGRRSSRVWLAEEEHEAAEKAREGAKGGAAAQPGRNCGVMASLASRLNAIARSWPVPPPAWLPYGLCWALCAAHLLLVPGAHFRVLVTSRISPRPSDLQRMKKISFLLDLLARLFPGTVIKPACTDIFFANISDIFFLLHSGNPTIFRKTMAKHILLKCPAEKDEGDDAFAARPLCAKISDLTADTSCAGRVMKMFTVDGDEATCTSLVRTDVYARSSAIITYTYGQSPVSRKE
jgi:hypothetical protein